MKLHIVFAAVALVGSYSAGAQERIAVAELSPVPLYPADGQISDDLKQWYVFVDHAQGDIVVTYPDENATGRRVLRFGRKDQADPVIRASVSARNNAYVYEYTVQNGPAARKPLKTIAVPMAQEDSTLTATHPNWRVRSRRDNLARAGALRPEVCSRGIATQPNISRKGRSQEGLQLHRHPALGLLSPIPSPRPTEN